MTDTKLIVVKLVLDNIRASTNEELVESVSEMMGEVFGEEDMKDNPRCKLILMEVKTNERY